MQTYPAQTPSKDLQPPSEIEVICDDCLKPFKTERWIFGGKDFTSSVCTACMSERDVQEKLRHIETVRRERFEAEVPPLYRNTPDDLIAPILLEAACNWVYSPKGLGFVGETGWGKTSAIVRILERMSREGKTICFTTSTRLAEDAAAANQYEEGKREKREEAERRLSNCKKADITLIDDLGKSKLTERAESTLYELLEHRYNQQLPVFWTSNSPAAEILKRFSCDRGPAVVRRLTVTSAIISQYTAGM